MIKYLKRIKELDPSSKSLIHILFFNDGLWALFWFRIAHFLYLKKLKFISLFIMHKVKTKRGIEIHPGATIGKHLVIDHGVGVVIGETSIIGNNCLIYQGVTLGGTGKDKGKRHPTIGDNVMIGAGAKVLGNIYISNNSKIGANTIVVDSIYEPSTIIGCKGRIINKHSSL